MRSRLLTDTKNKIETEYFDREDREVLHITIVDNEDNKLRLNKYIWPLDDPWIMKANLLIQTNNDQNAWMARRNKVGYQYISRTHKVKKLYEPKLRRRIDALITGFMRKNQVHINGLVQIVKRNIHAAIVIFREFHVEYDPEPKLKEPPIDTLINGVMRSYGLHDIALRKIIEKYIDNVSGICLKWDRTLGSEYFFADSEWHFELKTQKDR